MQIQVQYFALMQAQAGKTEELIEVDSGSLVAIYQSLRQRYGFQFAPEHLRPVCNDQLVSWESEVGEGDQIAFLPPFSGG